jgi:hypothetical protein
MTEESLGRRKAVAAAEETDVMESRSEPIEEVPKSGTPDAGAAAVLPIRVENRKGTTMRTR